MKRSVYSLSVVLLFGSAFVAVPFAGCSAENVADAPEIGAVVPNFELKDLDGNVHSLEQYRGKVVLIEMASQHCPWSKGADPHLVELAQKYAEQDVVIIGIDSHSSTSVADIKAYADEKGKSYPLLKDEGNVYADLIGAKVTPEIYVVDKEGKLVYHGAFDNRSKPEDKGDQAYAEKAVTAALAGETVDPARVKAWGCSIKRK